MCPLYPFHQLVMYALLMSICWTFTGNVVLGAVGKLTSALALNSTKLSAIHLQEDEHQNIDFYISGIPEGYSGELKIEVSSGDGLEHLSVFPKSFDVSKSSSTAEKPEELSDLQSDSNTSSISSGRYYTSNFTASGIFLGFSEVKFILSDGQDSEMMETEPVPAKVERGKHVLDKIFVHVVIILVIIVYINMGCTIDLTVIAQVLRRPIAPLIGLATQFVFMPLCSYGLGYFFLSNTSSLWLGLFVTGCSPGGGGSNMWTYLLGGSLDLSVTMTFISTLSAFVFMPFWIWLLGDTIYAGGKFDSPPFRNIGTLLIGLIVPIAIGLAIKRWYPKGANVLRKMLKPISVFFIVFVMTFGVYAYWFIFKFFTWRVAVCGLGLPWLGYMAGLCAAVLSGRPKNEVIAISIETGLQNTGLAIGLLKIALKPFAPVGDIAMVVPVAVATLTPVPLLIAYGVKSASQCRAGKDKADFVEISANTSSATLASP